MYKSIRARVDVDFILIFNFLVGWFFSAAGTRYLPISKLLTYHYTYTLSQAQRCRLYTPRGNSNNNFPPNDQIII